MSRRFADYSALEVALGRLPFFTAMSMRCRRRRCRCSDGSLADSFRVIGRKCSRRRAVADVICVGRWCRSRRTARLCDLSAVTAHAALRSWPYRYSTFVLVRASRVRRLDGDLLEVIQLLFVPPAGIMIRQHPRGVACTLTAPRLSRDLHLQISVYGVSSRSPRWPARVCLRAASRRARGLRGLRPSVR